MQPRVKDLAVGRDASQFLGGGDFSPDSSQPFDNFITSRSVLNSRHSCFAAVYLTLFSSVWSPVSKPTALGAPLLLEHAH